jgi:hypothetical protein
LRGPLACVVAYAGQSYAQEGPIVGGKVRVIVPEVDRAALLRRGQAASDDQLFVLEERLACFEERPKVHRVPDQRVLATAGDPLCVCGNLVGPVPAPFP